MLVQGAFLLAVATVSLADHSGGSYDYEQKYPPQPYRFGYETKDDYGTYMFRKESGDENGNVEGSYGYKDKQGIERVVAYVADKGGFRAQVKTNEPGTEDKDPADVELHADPLYVEYIPQKYSAVPQADYSVPKPAYSRPQLVPKKSN